MPHVLDFDLTAFPILTQKYVVVQDSNMSDFPPSYEDVIEDPSKSVIEPAILVQAGQFIYVENAASRPLYQISRDITVFPQKESTVMFERIEHSVPEKAESKAPVESRNRHLYYVVHPASAQYRKDIPAYYLTSASPGMLGNINFELSKPSLGRVDMTALLSADKSSADNPPFDEKSQRPLFSVKSKWRWNSGRYTWLDCDDKQVAFEERRKGGDKPKLVITAPLQGEMRDALVALWILKLWHDTAESREAKRDGKWAFSADICCHHLHTHLTLFAALERMTPPEEIYSSMKFAKRAGAMSGVAAGGGGC